MQKGILKTKEEMARQDYTFIYLFVDILVVLMIKLLKGNKMKLFFEHKCIWLLSQASKSATPAFCIFLLDA